MTVTKDERLQIRVDPAEKRLLERAAEASHVSVSAFVVQSAAAHAADVLAERQLVELGPDAAAAFTAALDGARDGERASRVGARTTSEVPMA